MFRSLRTVSAIIINTLRLIRPAVAPTRVSASSVLKSLRYMNAFASSS
ncbi:MAG: hypothetical protein LBK41_00525 [Clostridiales bacterium]|nr:hypothetical protein [Clostridiales bacterium]